MPSLPSNSTPRRPFFTSLAVITVIYGAFQAINVFFYKSDLTFAPGFSSSFLLLMEQIALLIFVLIILLPLIQKITVSRQKSISKPWRSFILLVLLVTLFNILIDPSGKTGLSLVPALDDTSRIVKSNYYSNLLETPNLVILGSSRTFTISPKYVYDTLGITAFNFGNAKYSIDEIPIQLRFIDDKSDSFPEILLLELLPFFQLNIQKAEDLTHFGMIPYMDNETAAKLIITESSDYISLQTFAESIYSLQFAIQNPGNLSRWTFEPNGLGIRNELSLDANLFERQLLSPNIIPTCTNYSAETLKLINEIMHFAYERNTAIIIYNSPVQPDFYAKFLAINPSYSRCQLLFNKLIDSLQQSYPNLFFLDFTAIESINGLPGQDGFYDQHHLTPINSNLLVDAAAETIDRAYQYALNARGNSR